eukprot:5519293-Lingulodinium_polyedra.AAC.1
MCPAASYAAAPMPRAQDQSSAFEAEDVLRVLPPAAELHPPAVQREQELLRQLLEVRGLEAASRPRS